MLHVNDTVEPHMSVAYKRLQNFTMLTKELSLAQITIFFAA
jgi:hypothetical protein